MQKSLRIARKLFGFAEKVHTLIWLLEVAGLMAVLTGIYTALRRYVGKDIDLFVIGSFFVVGFALLTLPRLVYTVYLRLKRGDSPGPIEQLHKAFEPRVTTPEGQSPYFKRKIRIVLQNILHENLDVGAPDWAADTGDLAIQPKDQGPGAASGLRLEDKHAGGWRLDKWISNSGPRITFLALRLRGLGGAKP